jgi:outer membrane protein assembly factor BamB
MRAPSSRPVLKWLILLFALGSTPVCCDAYTYIQVGVDSNFLVDDGRVLFAQSDGSLTALDLQTGAVLSRNKGRNFSGMLARVPQGLLVLNDQSIALLDPTNFSTLWETASADEPNVIGNDLISCDDDGVVQCRNLADGQIRWTYELPGTLQMVAEGDNVLVHRAATYDDASAPATVLLDRRSGRELFQKVPTNGVHWASAFFDGTNIYLVAGPYQGKRSDYQPERLLVCNTSGVETGSIPIPPALRQAVSDGDLFELDRKTFWKGRVYPNRGSIPSEQRGKSTVNTEQTNEVSRTFESDYDLGGNVTLVEQAKYLGGTNGGGAAFVMEIELQSPTSHWAGVLPYLLDHGRISAVTRVRGEILIGTDLGQVECINAANGESQWLYIFPTLRRTASYSSHGLPPTMSEAAEVFHRDNGNPSISGLHVINGKARAPHISIDPDPADPYRRLTWHLAIAWGGVGILTAALILVHIYAGFRRWESGIPGAIGVWLTFLLFCCYLFYGRVSPASSLALKAAILTGFLLGAFDAMRSFRQGLWLEGTVLIVTFLGIGTFIFVALV